jgi:uncharacterized protein with GYD domain
MGDSRLRVVSYAHSGLCGRPQSNWSGWGGLPRGNIRPFAREKFPVAHYDNGEESVMPTYILLSTLTPEGRHTLHKNPERLTGVNKEIQEFGCKVISQYATLGAYDFVTIVEAPDNETAAHLSIDLGSRGTVNITTLPALSPTHLSEVMKGPKQIGKD